MNKIILVLISTLLFSAHENNEDDLHYFSDYWESYWEREECVFEQSFVPHERVSFSELPDNPFESSEEEEDKWMMDLPKLGSDNSPIRKGYLTTRDDERSGEQMVTRDGAQYCVNSPDVTSLIYASPSMDQDKQRVRLESKILQSFNTTQTQEIKSKLQYFEEQYARITAIGTSANSLFLSKKACKDRVREDVSGLMCLRINFSSVFREFFQVKQTTRRSCLGIFFSFFLARKCNSSFF